MKAIIIPSESRVLALIAVREAAGPWPYGQRLNGLMRDCVCEP